MIELHLGDCLKSLGALPDCSVDAIVTDPPYGLSFMGKKWDYDVPSVEVWAECLRVLKPGGHLLAFAGTRTQHRMAVRIEDAGFEIRDMIAWCYASGFPKSLDVSKAIDKAAGAEREVVGRAKGAGAKDPDSFGNGHNPEYDITAPATDAARQWRGWGTALKPALEPITVARKPLGSYAWAGGRQAAFEDGHVCAVIPGPVTAKAQVCRCGAKRVWREATVAANVLEHGTGALNIDGCRVTDGSETGREKPAYEANRANAVYGAGMGGGVFPSTAGRWPANLIHDGSDEVLAAFPDSNGSGPARKLKRGERPDGDGWGMSDAEGELRDAGTGSAARFFYCAKASKKDRGEGNAHPTVKPTDLMRYLCRLVTPPGGVVLDPFMGSGSTGVAAILEGCRFIGCELSPEYLAIAQSRIGQALYGDLA